MVPLRALSGQVRVQIYFVLFVGFALAALQNVTVDDAVLTGAVVPQYLPTSSDWNIGNDCAGCLVQPNPSLAYNSTWHDATYSPGNGFSQAVELTFTGSALYIFFIIANTVPYATTLTAVDFVLDNANVSSYTHVPDNTTNYQYNVLVYHNEALAFGQHTITIQAANSGNNVLILFDYIIYSTDTSSSVSSSTLSSSPSQTPSVTQATSAGPNIGAVVGGVVGGVIVLVLVTTSLLCYWRYKKRDGGPPSPGEGAVVDPFVAPREVALVGTAPSTYPTYLTGSPLTGPASRSKTGTPATNLQPSIPTSSTAPISSPSASSSNNAGLLQQVELLRDEVARLRDMHGSDQDLIALHLESPPEYTG